jgi:thioredoxin 1
MAGENIVTIDEQNFGQEVTSATTPVMLDFWAPWCGPCKMIAPALDELATEYKGRVKVGKVNVDENQNLAVKFGISGIPAVFMVKGGEVIDQVVGARSKKDFKAMMDRAIS